MVTKDKGIHHQASGDIITYFLLFSPKLKTTIISVFLNKYKAKYATYCTVDCFYCPKSNPNFRDIT